MRVVLEGWRAGGGWCFDVLACGLLAPVTCSRYREAWGTGFPAPPPHLVLSRASSRASGLWSRVGGTRSAAGSEVPVSRTPPPFLRSSWTVQGGSSSCRRPVALPRRFSPSPCRPVALSRRFSPSSSSPCHCFFSSSSSSLCRRFSSPP